MEILVVLGVVALLVAILLPVLAHARASARQSKCSANLSEISRALQLKSHERGGFMPLAGSLSVEGGLSGYGSLPAALNDAGRTRYDYVRRPWMNAPAWQEDVMPIYGALAGQLGGESRMSFQEVHGWSERVAETRSLGVFLCPDAVDVDPADPYPPIQLVIGGFGDTYLWQGRMDYALNETIFGFDHTDSAARGRYRGQLSRIKAPSDMVLLADAASHLRTSNIFCWATARQAWDTRVTLADALTRSGRLDPSPLPDPTRHRGRANVLFADGHVRALPVTADGLREAVLHAGD